MTVFQYQHSKFTDLSNTLSALDSQLIIVDLDDTVMTSRYHACNAYWFEEFLSKHGKEKLPIIKNSILCSELNVQEPVLKQLNKWLVEQISAKTVLALTNRDINHLEISIKQCESLGIKFTKLINEERFEHDGRKILHNGIMHCSYDAKAMNYEKSKGIVLENLVKAIDSSMFSGLSKPNSIIFIDDLIENIIMVKTACEKMNIDCHLIHLTTVADNMLKEDQYTLENMGCHQDFSMKNCSKIPTNEEFLFKNAASGGFSISELAIYYG